MCGPQTVIIAGENTSPVTIELLLAESHGGWRTLGAAIHIVAIEFNQSPVHDPLYQDTL